MSCIIWVCHILHCGCTCHPSAVFFIRPSPVLVMQLDARHKNRILLRAVVSTCCWFSGLMWSLCDQNVFVFDIGLWSYSMSSPSHSHYLSVKRKLPKIERTQNVVWQFQSASGHRFASVIDKHVH